ncbi:MAG: hypothetical protein ACQES8_00010 [Thermodesulfobacteriota bacterium]
MLVIPDWVARVLASLHGPLRLRPMNMAGRKRELLRHEKQMKILDKEDICTCGIILTEVLQEIKKVLR